MDEAAQAAQSKTNVFLFRGQKSQDGIHLSELYGASTETRSLFINAIFHRREKWNTVV
jgi:hypothetical protein